MTETIYEKATFAGGCFWCMEPPFEKLEGVVEAISGYAGGHKDNPTYEEVSSGTTGHLEVIQIVYDPKKVTYHKLLETFWRNIDPTDEGGQFVDRGRQYKSAIFYQDEGQRKAAEASKSALQSSGRFSKPIVTQILPLKKFYAAEDYHQNFYKTNSLHYKSYRLHSGRDEFIEKSWKKEAQTCHVYTKEELKKLLNDLQYKVTQEGGTEAPFNNAYWNNKRDGIYVDVVSGEVLFSSKDKFDSGTGWPSFTKPLQPDHIVTHDDHELGTTRTEVRSRDGNSHLGHVFNDGPRTLPDGRQATGQRYCINSAALRFIPKEDLQKEGYGEYVKLFQ